MSSRERMKTIIYFGALSYSITPILRLEGIPAAAAIDLNRCVLDTLSQHVFGCRRVISTFTFDIITRGVSPFTSSRSQRHLVAEGYFPNLIRFVLKHQHLLRQIQTPFTAKRSRV